MRALTLGQLETLVREMKKTNTTHVFLDIDLDDVFLETFNEETGKFGDVVFEYEDGWEGFRRAVY